MVAAKRGSWKMLNMRDESFTYTLHNADGTKKTVVGNNNDVYIFLRDKLDLDIFRLEKKIDKLEAAVVKSLLAIMLSFIIAGIVFWGMK